MTSNRAFKLIFILNFLSIIPAIPTSIIQIRDDSNTPTYKVADFTIDCSGHLHFCDASYSMTISYDSTETIQGPSVSKATCKGTKSIVPVGIFADCESPFQYVRTKVLPSVISGQGDLVIEMTYTAEGVKWKGEGAYGNVSITSNGASFDVEPEFYRPIIQ